MDCSQLPQTAFIDPTGGNHPEVKRLAQQILELLLSHLTSAANHSPLPTLNRIPGSVSIPEIDRITKLFECVDSFSSTH